MARRYDVRLPMQVKVKVSGRDRSGQPFSQTASTVDVSRTGARLDGIACVEGKQTVEVSRGWFKKARFLVAWTGKPGTAESMQIGVRCLEPDSNVWGVDFPPPQLKEDYVPRQEATAAGAMPVSGPIPVGGWKDTTYTDAPVISGISGGPPGDVTSLGSSGLDKSVADEHRVAVTIRWTKNGVRGAQSGVSARVLKDGSCMLSLRTSLLESTQVELYNEQTRETRRGKVNWCGPRTADGSCPVAVELSGIAATFWKPETRPMGKPN